MLKFKVTGEITVSPLATSENEFKEGLEKVINEWLRGNVCNYQGGVSVELVDGQATNGRLIGYECNQDCTLDYTNFEAGDEILIDDHCEDSNWKGTDWYNSFPQIFEKIYEYKTNAATY